MKGSKVFEGDIQRAKSNILYAGSVLKVCAPKDFKEKELISLMWGMMDYALDLLERVTVLYHHLTKETNR